ncbi:MAG TPA: NAD(P)/FAD-dependent oxidoreductase [Coleofasciculaceae cyanobacterium]
MAVDYDLVIIGGSAVGRYAAAQAAQCARVALVESAPPAWNELYHSTFLHAVHLAEPTQRSPHWGVQRQSTFDLEKTLTWAQGVAENLEDQGIEGRSLPLLAAAGVDVVIGQGEFLRRPRWGFSVNGRLLRSRAFLLAPAASCRIPAMPGLETLPYLTLDTVWQDSVWQKPFADRLIIWGNDPRGIELAQAWRQLGAQVTIISPDVLLPQADREMANLVQAHLEAEGVDIFTQAIVQRVDAAQKQIRLIWRDRGESGGGDRTLEADTLLLATPPCIDLTSLNLDAVGVKWHPRGIVVNRKLQTTHPRIYACGTALGGSAEFALARHEATLAVRNALFWPQSAVRYGQVPFALMTAPELAQVGLTEAQARQAYGAEVRVLKQFTKTLPKAQIQGDPTGCCKLIVHRKGDILGGHWVGRAASEAIGIIALAMQQNIKIQAIAQLSMATPTHAELLQAIAQQWRLAPWKATGIETWLSLRRDWSS